uniref:HORMA domain-containing protein 1 n=1 Tax=Ictidomys tridecemlineatus TaxID=43179 RepID=UPI001A9FEF5A|nr:HORMA domain-containing protein 1 [Ictidomys tridecemlineatus]
MATAQLQRTSMSALVFPSKISTEQQSLVLVKRLLAVSVSCITYLRGIFPECAYGTRYLDDLCVKILREDKNCPGSTQLVKCLHVTISECYQFKFKYTKNGPIMDFISKNQSNESSMSSADTKKASILLIRKIYILMQNLGPLPNDVCLTMKLFYYDEVTPPDYQPPGFKDGDCEGVIFEGEPMYLNVGEVPTPFHTFKVKVTTEKERMENIDSAILSPKQLKTPLQKILMDKDDLEDDQEHYISVSYKVEQLVSKTSELDVSESKTRSGKVFQNKMANGNPPVKSSKENRKRNQPESGKTVLHHFDSSSQESVPKRRKFSEPKEHM